LKAAISSTLIASLELARDAQVDLQQYEPFGTITVRRSDRGAEDGQTDDRLEHFQAAQSG
jgi:chromatin segregation and condensation protein Rec8/ScpA/Scc1 (kleisin family)